jgi:nucleotide-binding universal stress UspA family protein
MNMMNQPAVVVGVSGSRASAAALRWAVDEAKRRHALLRIVRCWEPEIHAPYAPVGGQLTRAQQREAASQGLAALIRAEFGTETPAGVTAELARGTAERTLVDRSAGADLLVLGSESPPTAAGRSIGPVIRACLSRAECPVVVCAADQAAGRAKAGTSSRARASATRRRPLHRSARPTPLVVVR